MSLNSRYLNLFLIASAIFGGCVTTGGGESSLATSSQTITVTGLSSERLGDPVLWAIVDENDTTVATSSKSTSEPKYHGSVTATSSTKVDANGSFTVTANLRVGARYRILYCVDDNPSNGRADAGETQGFVEASGAANAAVEVSHSANSDVTSELNVALKIDAGGEIEESAIFEGDFGLKYANKPVLWIYRNAERGLASGFEWTDENGKVYVIAGVDVDENQEWVVVVDLDEDYEKNRQCELGDPKAAVTASSQADSSGQFRTTLGENDLDAATIEFVTEFNGMFEIIID